jgi:hypothetical protein
MQSLSSWLEQHAAYYQVDLETLFFSGLNFACPPDISVLDFSPDEHLVAAISAATGLSNEQISSMTALSLAPVLVEKLTGYTWEDVAGYRDSFRCFWTKSLEKRIDSWLPEERQSDLIPWIVRSSIRKTTTLRTPVMRYCPKCAKEPKKLRKIVWYFLPFTTCPYHNEFLVAKATDAHSGPIDKNLLNILSNFDAMNEEALLTGLFTLFNKDEVPATVWFRFLRGVVADITTTNKRNTAFQEKLDNVWNKLGLERTKDDRKMGWFELMAPVTQRRILAVVAFLIEEWPERILDIIPETDLYARRQRFPFALSKHLDFPMVKDFPDGFSSLSFSLQMQGIFDELHVGIATSDELAKEYVGMLENLCRIPKEDGWKEVRKIREKAAQRAERRGAFSYIDRRVGVESANVRVGATTAVFDEKEALESGLFDF